MNYTVKRGDTVAGLARAFGVPESYLHGVKTDDVISYDGQSSKVGLSGAGYNETCIPMIGLTCNDPYVCSDPVFGGYCQAPSSGGNKPPLNPFVGCPTGYKLVNGLCIPPTTQITGCPPGQVIENGKCTFPTPVGLPGECPAGQIVDIYTNECVGEDRITCPAGFYVDASTNTCVANPTVDGYDNPVKLMGDCQYNSDCRSDEFCDQTTMTCAIRPENVRYNNTKNEAGAAAKPFPWAWVLGGMAASSLIAIAVVSIKK